jgi:GH25 family lysozyme M1 (1,4-beta-N-acetylmuramidase)
LNFDNQNITLFDLSFWQAILRDEYGKLLPPDKQKHVDFQKMKSNGVASAVVIRAGQDTYLDSEFRTNWENAKKALIPRASYWFCDKDSTPQSQARLYWNTLKPDMGEGFLAGDIEYGSWDDWNSYYIFFNELQQLSGLPNEKIVLYSNYYFWLEHVRTATSSQRRWFSKFPFWLASYIDPIYSSKVLCPPEWTSPTVWQWGTPAIGLENGAWSKEIDANLWNGGIGSFNKMFGNIPTPPTPEEPPVVVTPTPITINKIGMVATDVLNIRSGAGINYSIINTLNRGDKVFGELNSEDWFHFEKIERANGTIEYLNAWCSGNYKYLFIKDNYSTPDVVKFPYEGISLYTIRYDGHTNVHVVKINMGGKKAMITNNNGLLRKTSDVAKELNAQIAVNMDAWNELAPYYPLGYAASNGVVYSDRRIGVPFLNISKDQKLSISHNNYSGYNAASGFRYIVQNGVKSSYLSGSDVQYIERHPRRAVGIIDENNLVLIATDGRSSQNAGITLSEAADILLRFGVKTGFDNDSGGSTSLYVESLGGSIGEFSDGVERPTVNQLCLFMENTEDTNNGGNNNMADLKLTSSDPIKTRSIRGTAPMGRPHIYGSSFAQINIGSYAKAKSEDKYVYLNDVVISGAMMAKTGDIWHKVYEANGNPTGGWTAEIHLGMRQLNVEDLTVVVPPPVEPPVPTVVKTHTMELFSDGSLKVDGNLIP